MDKSEKISRGAREIAEMLDSDKGFQAQDRLQSDYLNMDPRDFQKLLKQVQQNEKAGTGSDLIIGIDTSGLGLPPIRIRVPKPQIVPGHSGYAPINEPKFKAASDKERAIRMDPHKGKFIEQQ